MSTSSEEKGSPLRGASSSQHRSSPQGSAKSWALASRMKWGNRKWRTTTTTVTPAGERYHPERGWFNMSAAPSQGRHVVGG